MTSFTQPPIPVPSGIYGPAVPVDNALLLAGSANVVGRSWLALGDSITQGSGASVADTDYVTMLGKIVGNTLIKYPINNQGVSGWNTNNLLAALPGILAASSSNAATLMIGTNDSDPAVNTSLTQYAANIVAIKKLLDAAGVKLVVGTVPPIPVAYGPTRSALIATYNTWLRLWGKIVGVAVAETFGPLVDVTTGYMNAAYVASNPPHPNDAGHLLLAQAFAATIEAFPTQAPLWPLVQGYNGTSGADPNQVSYNGWNADPYNQSTNQGTNAVPTWTVEGPTNPAITLVAASAGDGVTFGQWKRFTVNNNVGATPTTGSVILYQNNQNFSPGDELLFGCLIKGSEAAAINKIQIVDAGLVSHAVIAVDFPSAAPGPVLFSYTVPGNWVSSYLAVSITIAAEALSTEWVQVGLSDIVNLTKTGMGALLGFQV